MVSALTLSSDTRTTAGILLLTIVAVEYGGLTVVTNVLARDGDLGGRDPLPRRFLPLLRRQGGNAT